MGNNNYPYQGIVPRRSPSQASVASSVYSQESTVQDSPNSSFKIPPKSSRRVSFHIPQDPEVNSHNPFTMLRRSSSQLVPNNSGPRNTSFPGLSSAYSIQRQNAAQSPPPANGFRGQGYNPIHGAPNAYFGQHSDSFVSSNAFPAVPNQEQRSDAVPPPPITSFQIEGSQYAEPPVAPQAAPSPNTFYQGYQETNAYNASQAEPVLDRRHESISDLTEEEIAYNMRFSFQNSR